MECHGKVRLGTDMQEQYPSAAQLKQARHSQSVKNIMTLRNMYNPSIPYRTKLANKYSIGIRL